MIAGITKSVISLGSLPPLNFDEEYVRKLRDADPEVEQHFIAYFSRLLPLRLRGRISEEFIEDTTQNTFLRIFEILRSKGGPKHPERLAAFVLGVCDNVSMEIHRKERWHEPLEEGMDPPDRCVDAAGMLANEELKKIVTEVLGQLSPQDRGILRMLFIDEESKDAICQKYGIAREYLRVLVFRARSRFRIALGKSGGRGLQEKAPYRLVNKKGVGNGS
jgi:RNA polymerase sigma-70 factor, ECF subfamily